MTHAAPVRSGLSRALFLAGGLICVALGMIGAVLPIMPTAVFMLAAVFCFARSSPRLEAWILNHRHFGPPVRLWLDHGAIGPMAKVASVVSIYAGFLIVVFFDVLPTVGDIALVSVLSLIALFVGTRPSGPPPEPDDRPIRR